MKPVYIINGFLGSGKTEFINFTLDQPYFQSSGKTLLLLCEEGEEEYDPYVLKRSKTIVETIEEEADFTPEKMVELEKKYHRTHSGWIGGLKETQYKTLMAEASDKAMTYAVKGMVPSNTLGAKAMTRLHCYKTAEHAHAAQKPEVVEF
mgnify:CR=1 FL=1